LVELLDVLEMLEVMRCALLCIPEAVEGGLCLPEVRLRRWRCAGGVLEVCCKCAGGDEDVLEVLEVLEVPEVMCCVPLRMLGAMEGKLCLLQVLEEPVVSFGGGSSSEL
jgi:hypothetical protein